MFDKKHLEICKTEYPGLEWDMYPCFLVGTSPDQSTPYIVMTAQPAPKDPDTIEAIVTRRDRYKSGEIRVRGEASHADLRKALQRAEARMRECFCKAAEDGVFE